MPGSSSPHTVAPLDAPGPDEPFDVNVDHTTFDKLGLWLQSYGDIIAIPPLKRGSPSLFLNNPEHIKQVLIGNHKNYAKGVGFERVAMLLGNGIIVSDGEFWRAQRRMIQPVFHKKIVAELATMMQRLNQQKLVQWQQKAADGEVIDLTTEMSALALDVILRALFSDDLDRLIEEQGANPFAMLVEDVTRDLKLAMRFRALTRHVAAIMDIRRKQNRIEHDFLSWLMETRDKDTLQPMSDKALIDEVMTIIVAGHETTAGTLNWAWYLLSQHQNVEHMLQLEVDALPNDPGFEDLGALAYTHRVIDETLRLYPPVWLFSRKAIAEDTFNVGQNNVGQNKGVQNKGVHDKHVQDTSGEYKVEIPAGTDIFLSPYYLHRDERHWPDPHTFNPDRFTDAGIRERNRHVYFPFSLGSRRCIGEFFSMVDMQLHLGLLARYIRLEHVASEPVRIEPLINLRSQHSIMMMPHKRTQ